MTPLTRVEVILEARFGPRLKAVEGRAAQAWEAIGERMVRDGYGRLLFRLLQQQAFLGQEREN